jgi:Bacterial virulence factor lipase N-terminal
MKHQATWTRTLATLTAAAALSGCGGSGGGGTANPVPAPAVTHVYAYAQLDPSAGSLQALPIPSDALLRSSVTGLNNLPGSTEPVTSFNTLKGFSTSAPIYIPLQGSIDQTTVTPTTVLVLDATTKASMPMTLSVSSGQTGDTIVATPVLPLQANTRYEVILTSGVLTSSGDPVMSATVPGLLKSTTALVDGNNLSLLPGVTDFEAQQLEKLRQAWQPIWTLAESVTGVTRADIPMAFSFTTQALHDTLQKLNAKVQTTTAASPTVSAILPGQLSGTIFGTANVQAFYTAVFTPSLGAGPAAALASTITHVGGVYTGTYSSPDYIDYTDGSNPAGKPWTLDGTGVPVAAAPRTQQFIAFLPPAPAPALGFPTVIYVHGITRNMLDSMLVADALNSQGIAVIAVNQPLHGSNDLIPANAYQHVVVNGVDQGDGYTYLNLANLRVGRDNLRQSVADLYELTHLITAGNTKLDTTNYANQPLLAQTPPAVVGQSLGAINAATYSVTEKNNELAVLNVGGGRIGSLLQNSQVIGAEVNAQLALNQVNVGTAAYQNFFWMAQALIDDADPFNYVGAYTTDVYRGGATAGGHTHNMLLQEMIGDDTVPNSAAADLALAANLPQAYAKSPISGLNQVSTTPVQGSMLYQFRGGAHGFLINGSAQTALGQQQVVGYVGSYFAAPLPSITNVQPGAKPAGTGAPTSPLFDVIVKPSGLFGF